MTLRGHVKNGQILLDEPAALPDGTEVLIEVPSETKESHTVWDDLLKLAGTAGGFGGESRPLSLRRAQEKMKEIVSEVLLRGVTAGE